jgi:hypothetical protein
MNADPGLPGRFPTVPPVLGPHRPVWVQVEYGETFGATVLRPFPPIAAHGASRQVTDTVNLDLLQVV